MLVQRKGEARQGKEVRRRRAEEGATSTGFFLAMHSTGRKQFQQHHPPPPTCSKSSISNHDATAQSDFNGSEFGTEKKIVCSVSVVVEIEYVRVTPARWDLSLMSRLLRTYPSLIVSSFPWVSRRKTHWHTDENNVGTQQVVSVGLSPVVPWRRVEVQTVLDRIE